MAITHTFKFDVGEVVVAHGGKRFAVPIVVEVKECRKTPHGNVYGIHWGNNAPGQIHFTTAHERVLRKPRAEDNAP